MCSLHIDIPIPKRMTKCVMIVGITRFDTSKWSLPWSGALLLHQSIPYSDLALIKELSLTMLS